MFIVVNDVASSILLEGSQSQCYSITALDGKEHQLFTLHMQFTGPDS